MTSDHTIVRSNQIPDPVNLVWEHTVCVGLGLIRGHFRVGPQSGRGSMFQLYISVIVLTVGVILMANTYDLFAKKEVSTNPSERQKAILAIAQNMGSKQPITQPQFGFAFVMPIIAILTAVACLILVILAACLCPSEAKKKEKSGKKDASGESGSKGGHKKNQSKPKK